MLLSNYPGPEKLLVQKTSRTIVTNFYSDTKSIQQLFSTGTALSTTIPRRLFLTCGESSTQKKKNPRHGNQTEIPDPSDVRIQSWLFPELLERALDTLDMPQLVAKY